MRSLVRSVLVGCAVAGLALSGTASAVAGGDEGDNDTRIGISKDTSGSGNDSVIPGSAAVFGALIQD